MRIRAGVLKLIYVLSIIYTCSILIQVIQVNWKLHQVKNLAQAVKLLDYDKYWILNLASRIMADGRDILSILIILLDEISVIYLLINCIFLTVFYRTRIFWRVFTMILLPYILYSLTLVPLIYGIFTQRVTSTIVNVNFMALITVCLAFLFIINYVIKLILFSCGILEVEGLFNYNGLERGDRNVRNNE